MDNNDILIRLRYALDIKDSDIIQIFKLGGIVLSKEEVQGRLTKIIELPEELDDQNIRCSHKELECFLNGFITFKRGAKEDAPPTVLTITGQQNVNNILLKKLKIALSLNSEDMLDIFALADISMSSSELSALFRKEGHKHYKECGDKFARNFLKGLALKYRS